MVVGSAAGPSKAVVSLPRSGLGPPWWFSLHPAAWLVTVALWVAALAGAGGGAAGLVAARGGAGRAGGGPAGGGAHRPEGCWGRRGPPQACSRCSRPPGPPTRSTTPPTG